MLDTHVLIAFKEVIEFGIIIELRESTDFNLHRDVYVEGLNNLPSSPWSSIRG